MARPRKSTAQKKAEGTLRSRDKPQAEAEQAIALAPLLSVLPPAWLPPALVPTWRSVTSDLCAMGAIIPGDLILLEQAFRMMANTMSLQSRLDEALAYEWSGSDDEEPRDMTATIAKLSASIVAQEAAYERILGKFGITPSERARLLTSLPRPKTDKKKGAMDFIKGTK